MLTGDQNLLDIAYSVRWNIRTPELYLFQLAQPDETISEVAESAMRAVVSQVTLNDAMGDRRAEIETQVAENMQRILDTYRSGIQVQGIAIKQADPPDAVNDAFKQVTAAQQDAQTYINSANAYRCSSARRRRARRPRSTRSMSNTSSRPKSPAAACITRRWSRCFRRSTRRSSKRPASRPICRCRRCRSSSSAGAAAMIDFIPQPPARCRAIIGLVLLPAAQQLPDRSGDQAGGRRPLRQAGADPQPVSGRAGRSAPPGAGISWRIPFAEQIVWIDKRVQDVDMQRQQVLSTDQRRLEVDAFARYRIVDPLLMYIRAGPSSS